MPKKYLVLFLSVFLIFACSKKEKAEIISEPSEEEKIIILYQEAVNSLKIGDAFYAGTKFKEVESLLPQSKWAAKASLMAAYADYSRSSYGDAVFGLERHVTN